MPSRSFLHTLLPFLLGVLAPALPAQCPAHFQPGDPLRDVVGDVTGVISWDPDGAGPLPLAPTIGGRFAVGQAMTTAAWHDGTQWHPVGAADHMANCIAVFAGQLAVGTPAGVDLWNGTSWQSIGTVTGVTGSEVHALTTYQGLLVAAGSFSSVNGVAAGNIAQWNGTAWTPLGAGTSGPIRAMAVFNGSLHVGGSFSTAGGVTHQNYGIWNGSGWTASPDFNGTIRALAARLGSSLTNSFLFAGGAFTAIGAAPNQVAAARLARFSPSTNTWADFNSGSTTDTCEALTVRSTGINSYEVAALLHSPAAPFSCTVRKWSAGTWSPVGGSLAEPVHALGFVGGAYTVGTRGVVGNGGVQRFNGTTWQSLTGLGLARTATAVCDGGADVVLADDTGVQRGAAGAWTPMPGLVGTVRVLARMPNGDIVAGGLLTMASGAPTSGVARWNGSTWNPLAGGVLGEVEALLPLPNGELIVGGAFAQAGAVAAANIARWTGSAWQAIGGGTGDRVRALITLPGGDLVAAGDFTTSGSPGVATPRIARWNGTAWTAMTTGTGFDQPVHTLAFHGTGVLFAGGAFTTYDQQPASGIARWLGDTTWSPLLTTPAVHRLVALGSGNLLITTIAPPNLLLRLGGQFTELLAESVVDVQPAGNGDVLIAGAFPTAGDVVAQGFARYTTPCPATAAQSGAGCAGTTLTADTLPWTGSTYRATARGVPTPAFVFHVLGLAALQPPLPLVTVLPQALPGCLLHAGPDVVEASVVLAGDLSVQLVVPTSVALNATTLQEQIVALQVGAGSAITAVTASNALTLTIGVF